MYTRLCEDHRSLLREKCPTQTEASLKFITTVATNIRYFNHPNRLCLSQGESCAGCVPSQASLRRGRGCPGPAPGGLTTGPRSLSMALRTPVRTTKWHLAARCEGKSVRNGPVSTKDEKERGGNALERTFPCDTRECSVAEPGKWGSREGGILTFVSQHPALFSLAIHYFSPMTRPFARDGNWHCSAPDA